MESNKTPKTYDLIVNITNYNYSSSHMCDDDKILIMRKKWCCPIFWLYAVKHFLSHLYR